MLRRWLRSGLTRKLTIPFILVFVGGLSTVGILSIRFIRSGMIESLNTRTEILVDTLSTALADPLSLNEFDRIQALLEKAVKADPDVTYAIVLNAKGEAIGSTDPALRGQVLLRTDFEKAMARATGLTRQGVPGSRTLIDMATPVNFQGLGQIGVIRIGVSTDKVEAVMWRATASIAGVGLLALMTGIALYLSVARRVARPLEESVGRLRELASGEADLTLRLAVTSDDEVGQLAQALNTFLDKQHDLIHEIHETSFQVGSASQHLSGATAHLSTGAQEQVSSLEETAASLEELSGTVKQNADHAKQANQLALGSRDTAERGGNVATAAVAAMGEINKAAKKISDIITTIDEIAFQTNLLALNAAVEAARAGEQGRGFAVVAAEVRNLAQRSASAAKEIKALIHDSVQKVQDGSELVNQSGQKLQEIVASVKRVADIIAEIAAASQEQSVGIDQVNRAVSQMEQVTQANSAQTEELSSTAQSLAAQAQQLQARVRRFKLDGISSEAPGPGAHRISAVPTKKPQPALAGARLAPPPPYAGDNGFDEF